MDQFGSPDVPAYICYLVVWAVGTWAAVSNVDKLLADIPGHWRFSGTWLLFAAYVAIPLLLFWFLDYTSALHDTSVFAALVVAVGYQQIFAGGVQGIVMPGQTPRLWKPFEAWATGVADRIATLQKQYRDELDDRVRKHLASDSGRARGLLAMAYEYTSNIAGLEGELAALDARKRPADVTPEEYAGLRERERVRILLRQLRSSRPQHYGRLLLQEGLVSKWFHWLWFADGKAKAIAWMMGLFMLALTFAAIFGFMSDPVQLQYHHWRFTKSHATEADQFRSREYLADRIKSAAPNSQDLELVLSPVLGKLRFAGVRTEAADDILRLITDSHSPEVDAVTIPLLIEALRTENADVRLRIHRTLLDLQRADFPNQELPQEIVEWVPAGEESPGQIDRYVSAWWAWWRSVQ